jgi:flagellar L-ring protein precursor FlgH
MKQVLRLLTLTLTLIFIVNIGCGASSLFVSSPSSMYSDYKAREVGDLVTVLIIEQAQASQSANTATTKDASVGLGPGGGVLADLIPLLRLSGGDEFAAVGKTTRGGSITAKLTTRVSEIHPNGTLTVEGRQKIIINGEEQEIVIKGVVRSRDISSDNTILSSLVADSEIHFVGTGAVGDKQEPGILTRFFNWLF